MAIPNCRGCQEEMAEAYEWQERGYDAGLEGMGERKHCSVFVIDKNGKFIIEYLNIEDKEVKK